MAVAVVAAVAAVVSAVVARLDVYRHLEVAKDAKFGHVVAQPIQLSTKRSSELVGGA